MTAAAGGDEPQVWHYGLMAERWAEFLNDAPEVPFLLDEIAQHGQPVLDLCCGAGRLLRPLRATGIDIDGCDISSDMLEQCRRKLAEAGMDANLSPQPMDAFEMPRRYRTIYIASSLGLAGSRERDLETLRRCHAHLEGGGALLLDNYAEYVSAESWDGWLPERRRALPEPWPEEGTTSIGVDGSVHVARFRSLENDPLELTYTREVRLEKWQAGTLVSSEQYTLRGNAYLMPEVLLMLRVAGFRDIAVKGDFVDRPATPDDARIVFVASREGDGWGSR